MNLKTLNRIFAALVFIISLWQFAATVQPSVSFWDCGEFIAAAYYLQVPHPPGTPFFLIVGNIFSKIPFVENIGLRVNFVSVISSALSVLLLYLIAIKLIKNYKQKEPENLFEGLTLYISAAIGALAFSFSDTFWFNGVEAEVYAFSTFLFAAVTYLIMRWNERADNPDAEKYIIMIAYLVGLSTGVHLMSVLAIVPVVMIIMFRKYVNDEESLKKTSYIFLIHSAIVLLLAVFWWAGETSTTPPSPEQYQAFDSKFKIFILGVSALIMGIYYKKVFTRNSFYMPLIIGGIALAATYPGVVKYFPALLTAIGGENITIEILVVLITFAVLGYLVHYSVKNNKPTLHLVFMSAIFILLGFTTFAMVIIRSNQNPPMNENEPNTFPKLEKYLNREQYGDFPTFKRRFSAEPHQQGIYTNYSSDLDFFYSYQMNHMMTRYWLWNFAGREGWVQDQGANIAPFNAFGNAFGKLLGIKFNGEVKDSLFGIPFLIGLLGIYFHFRKDWKMASAFMIMFILMGYLTAFYQNQQQPQPRERDYFYVGAFFVFAIWISVGIYGLIELVNEKIKRSSYRQAAVVGIMVLGIVLIPVKMFSANYFTHDRSRNWVPWDYSYNLLQSCAPNSVLFTNGDNDTFPLWYLQDVEGVRRDVKIVNLSLLNTDWYIRQMKNNDPYGVGTVRIRFSDDQINQMRPMQWNATQLSIPLPRSASEQGVSNDFIQKYGIKDSTVLKEGKITWTMQPTLNFGNVTGIRVQDIMVREIVEANNWERPIYFAVTCSDDSKIGLHDYLRMEGMAFRLVPEKRSATVEFVEPDILAAQLKENPGYSKDYQPGFKFRGLNDPTIFLDDNHKRMIQNYRNAFIRLTLYYLSQGQNELAAKTLDDMDSKMPNKLIPLELGLMYELGNLYARAGAMEQFNRIAAEVETLAIQKLEENPSDAQSFYNPYRILMDIYERQQRNDKLYELWKRIEALYPNDPNVKANVEKYRMLLQNKDTSKVK
ncbi:MAG: DUF2723 domain-containing protein [Ignavibacterium album]|uniref:protein O-mannosyl-transferase family n=1 Tax=Ignavibacterium album TaxID=591197 RepID=UPI0026ECD49E|nr:DUF2723 domain-containing protein [Ignavibacterium album]MBI5662426.1 DUF2723 domain-containing protein [Ignavibacterium album]